MNGRCQPHAAPTAGREAEPTRTSPSRPWWPQIVYASVQRARAVVPRGGAGERSSPAWRRNVVPAARFWCPRPRPWVRGDAWVDATRYLPAPAATDQRSVRRRRSTADGLPASSLSQQPSDLIDALDDPGSDLQAILAVLVDRLIAAVPSFLGLTMTLRVAGRQVTLTAIDPGDLGVVRSSLQLPLDPLAGAGPGQRSGVLRQGHRRVRGIGRGHQALARGRRSGCARQAPARRRRHPAGCDDRSRAGGAERGPAAAFAVWGE